MLPEAEEKEFQALFAQFKAQPELNKLLGSVKYEDFFTYEFMADYSDFSSMDDMLFRSGFGIMSLAEVANIPPANWDAYIAKHTKYQQWFDFGKKAMTVWMQKKIAETNLPS